MDFVSEMKDGNEIADIEFKLFGRFESKNI